MKKILLASHPPARLLLTDQSITPCSEQQSVPSSSWFASCTLAAAAAATLQGCLRCVVGVLGIFSLGDGVDGARPQSELMTDEHWKKIDAERRRDTPPRIFRCPGTRRFSSSLVVGYLKQSSTRWLCPVQKLFSGICKHHTIALLNALNVNLARAQRLRGFRPTNGARYNLAEALHSSSLPPSPMPIAQRGDDGDECGHSTPTCASTTARGRGGVPEEGGRWRLWHCCSC